MMRCINIIGYEGRLTEGKVYPCQVNDSEFATVTLDDGTMAAVFIDRFIREARPKPKPKPKPIRGITPEEGVRCSTCGSGTWGYDPVENCTCHLGHPPCGQCTSHGLSCSYCGLTEEEAGPKPEKSLEEGGLCDCENGTWHFRGPGQKLQCDYCGATTWERDGGGGGTKLEQAKARLGFMIENRDIMLEAVVAGHELWDLSITQKLETAIEEAKADIARLESLK